jgi:hypothetical protein
VCQNCRLKYEQHQREKRRAPAEQLSRCNEDEHGQQESERRSKETSLCQDFSRVVRIKEVVPM